MSAEITIIPVSKVVDTIIENLIKGGVILESEKEQTRKTVEAMNGQELIETLLESHAIAEAIRNMSN